MKSSTNNLYKIALFLCCIAASPNYAVATNILCPDQPKENYCDCTGDCSEKPEWCQCAEAKECCEENTVINVISNSDNSDNDTVICPNQPKENYCDCAGDCSEKPEWCQCAEAKECCEKFHSDSDSFINNVIVNRASSDGSISCPGQSPDNYCDCEGDCTGNPDFCGCEEAQECCKGATPVVFCPDQPKENYCDCTEDCTENSEFCACAEGTACCAENSSNEASELVFGTKSCGSIELLIPLVLGFAIFFVFVAFLKHRNKKEERQGASYSEAAAKVVSPPVVSKSDDEETVASTTCGDA